MSFPLILQPIANIDVPPSYGQSCGVHAQAAAQPPCVVSMVLFHLWHFATSRVQPDVLHGSFATLDSVE
jgi:hypothetical protein